MATRNVGEELAIDRRTVLRALGVAGGVAVLGSVPGRAQSDGVGTGRANVLLFPISTLPEEEREEYRYISFSPREQFVPFTLCDFPEQYYTAQAQILDAVGGTVVAGYPFATLDPDEVAGETKAFNVATELRCDDWPDTDPGFPVLDFGEVATPPGPIGDETEPPTDPDGDGKYEDLNGNGDIDFDDINLLYDHLVSGSEPVEPFDFNDNGIIDFDDINELYGELVGS